MTNRNLRWVLRLHPRAWRERYSEEVCDLSEELLDAREMGRTRLVLGLVGSALLEHIRTPLRKGRLAVLSAVVAVVVVAGAVALATNLFGSGKTSISGSSLTAGTVPPSQNGSVDPKKIPDFIATVGRTGKLVGYVPRAYLFPSHPNSPVSSKLGGVVPVYARNLKILVGHMYPDIGFVPLGKTPESQPCPSEVVEENGVSRSVLCPSTTETLPNVVGMVTPSAAGELSGLSFGVQVMNVHSISVPPGHIVSMSPAPGPGIHARTVVTIENSLGPRAGKAGTAPISSFTITVPNAVGMTEQQASRVMKSLGLKIRVLQVPIPSAPTDVVVVQEPVAGAIMPGGALVTLSVPAAS
jgi:hypothetical protein